MVRYGRRRRRHTHTDENPMSGTSNIVDCMLVLALGFMIMLVLSWNMQDVVFNKDMSQEQKQTTMQAMQQVAQVTQGKELNETPQNSKSSGQGYVEQGKVYKDPKTGKLIMVQGG
ncbi:hypothetical protein BGI41_02780 [Methanobrevibacter sp. 87.7]|uniref:DUF2149 domain-containing protein n=1 Tax=Methanobrevibacter sp. 87.7 TaxID=387957 RepID=UPI000B508614|nr:DUF2149 domain-containing protein [Methanobrevibacter sp. 87.7]OWT33354.1 hypothetical protein BGI41_02780 [Methanobrevibacter sp. 87.7]